MTSPKPQSPLPVTPAEAKGWTEGEWKRGFHDEIGVDFGGAGGGSWFALIAEGRDCPVALVPETDTGGRGRASEECEANAHLIAASKALYEALRKARGSLHDYMWAAGPIDDDDRALLALIDAALLKANPGGG